MKLNLKQVRDTQECIRNKSPLNTKQTALKDQVEKISSKLERMIGEDHDRLKEE